MKKKILIALVAVLIIAPLTAFSKKEHDKKLSKSQEKSEECYVIGLKHYNNKQYKKALENIDLGLDYYETEKLYLLRSTINQQIHNTSELLKDYTHLIELNANETDYYNARGQLYIEKGYYDLALNDLKKSISLKDEQWDMIYLIGCIYQYQKNFNESLKQAEFLLKNDDKEDYHKLAGENYYFLKKYKESVPHLEKYLKSNEDENTSLLLGISYFELKRYEEAINQLLKVKENDDVNLTIGQCYYQLNDYQKSLTYLNKYLKNNKNKAVSDLAASCEYMLNQTNANINQIMHADYQKAVQYYQKKNYKKAITHLLTYMKKTKDNRAYYLLGICYQMEESYDLAIQAFSKCIQKNIEKGNSYYNRGIMYLSKKDYKKAVDDFQHSYDLGIQKDYSKYNQGIAYMNQSLFKESTRCFVEVRDTSQNEELVKKAKDILSRYYVT